MFTESIRVKLYLFPPHKENIFAWVYKKIVFFEGKRRVEKGHDAFLVV